jgi:formylglycine-generating enzyme required for sulfatase activity
MAMQPAEDEAIRLARKGVQWQIIGVVVAIIFGVPALAIPLLDRVENSTPTPIPLGDSGNPITANADWSPVLQELGGIPMVKVPAGCFMMGNNDGNENERPAHQQCFDAPFWIGQTEVTNTQYQAFMDAGGYTNAAYWTAAGWAWRQSESVTQPSCYTDSAFNQPDQPVVCVTWYEAMAYSAWLSAASGLTFRLPTEAEWEYASRGPDALIYPWGNTWNPDNVVWSGNAVKPAPVGSRPAGASWAGALDMSGIVWEWMSSQYQAYPYSATDGREDVDTQTDVLKALRGGAWFNNNTDFLRCDYRSRYAPRYVLSGGGFRLALS